jgi:hypothetical protein
MIAVILALCGFGILFLLILGITTAKYTSNKQNKSLMFFTLVSDIIFIIIIILDIIASFQDWVPENCRFWQICFPAFLGLAFICGNHSYYQSSEEFEQIP